MVAWSVERLLHKKCHLLVVDRIPLMAYLYNLTIHTELSNQRPCKGTPSRFPGTKVKMAGSEAEPLIQEADPHISKLAIEAWMQDKDGPNRFKKTTQVHISLTLE